MIIWVASYPKSGNTWVRSVITSLFKKNQNEIDFKDLYFVRQYPLRSDFSKLHKPDEGKFNSTMFKFRIFSI